MKRMGAGMASGRSLLSVRLMSCHPAQVAALASGFLLSEVGMARHYSGTNTDRLRNELYAALRRATAAYLRLCNGRLTAQECLQQGIVNKVAPKGQLIAAAEKLAEMVCLGSPLAVPGAVRLYGRTAAFPAALVSYARDMDQEIAETEDGSEGSRAFREKRKPNWKLR